VQHQILVADEPESRELVVQAARRRPTGRRRRFRRGLCRGYQIGNRGFAAGAWTL